MFLLRLKVKVFITKKIFAWYSLLAPFDLAKPLEHLCSGILLLYTNVCDRPLTRGW